MDSKLSLFFYLFLLFLLNLNLNVNSTTTPYFNYIYTTFSLSGSVTSDYSSFCPYADDGCCLISFPSNGFNIYGQIRTSYYVCTNGFISFDGSFTTYIPANLPFHNGIVFYPYWSDLDPKTCGSIQIMTSSTNNININILDPIIRKRYSKPTYTTTAINGVLWNGICHHNQLTSTGTFGTLFLTDSVDTFAIYFYGSGFLGTANFTFNLPAPGLIGVEIFSNTLLGSSYSYQHSNSLTPYITQASKFTNIDLSGLFIFHVSSNFDL